MSRFNEDVKFSDEDLEKITECLNKVNEIVEKHTKDDLENHCALVYEIGAMLVAQIVASVRNRNELLPLMLNDIQEDVVEYIDFHDNRKRYLDS